MKLHERQRVEDTSPTVYIGRRVYVNRRGAEQIAVSWYAEATCRGRTHYAPLRTASHSVAIHRAHQFAEKLRDAGDAVVRRRIDLTELARHYLGMQVNRGRKPKTLEKYEYILAAFVAWAKSNFRGVAEQFTEDHFWQWHRTMIQDGYSAKTRADRLIVIKQTFKWAARQKLIPSNPLDIARVVDPPPTPQPCFEPWQVQALLQNADEHERPIFATLAYTGIRFGELRDLRWNDISMPLDRPGHVLVRGGGSDGTPKDHEFRRIPLHPELRGILETLPRRGERVFYSPPSQRGRARRQNCPLNQSTWLKRLKLLCRRCGFAEPETFKLHTFRHVFASMCARNNVAHRYALAWMGHSSSEILDLYFKQFDSVADEAIRTIDYHATAANKPTLAPAPAELGGQ